MTPSERRWQCLAYALAALDLILFVGVMRGLRTW